MINELLQEIIDELRSDAGSIGISEIVDHPKGNREDRPEYKHFDHVYIDQSKGPCEDDCYGDLYIPIENGKYLKCWYIC